jgi:type IV/VI secretion system ImpK/VasF family protein
VAAGSNAAVDEKAESSSDGSKTADSDSASDSDSAAGDGGATPANSNQPPTAIHDAIARGIPVHSVRALEEIQDRLKKVLGAQAEKVAVLFQFDLAVFREAQYAMVALADEVFLGIPWKGRIAWQNLLLEGQVFRSQSSGETIFHRIELILSKYDQTKISLARIYFFILTIGFKGKYNDFKDADVINGYKRRIYSFIFGTNASTVKYCKQKIMQQCYDYTFSVPGVDRLPDIRFWTKTFVAIVLAYVFASHVLWYNIAGDFYVSLDNVFDRFSYFLSERT